MQGQMIDMAYCFRAGKTSQDITVRLSNVKQTRNADSSAPWDICVTITWGEEIAFDRPLSGTDPLHAVELAARFAQRYLTGRAHDEGGTLDPPIVPPAQ